MKMTRKFLFSLVLSAVSVSAFAGSCPILMGDIDAALADPAVEERIGADDYAEAKRLRQEGEDAHKAGDHADSEQALKKAKEILEIT
jgi:hypothetical protein